jgi:hypothetical protein
LEHTQKFQIFEPDQTGLSPTRQANVKKRLHSSPWVEHAAPLKLYFRTLFSAIQNLPVWGFSRRTVIQLNAPALATIQDAVMRGHTQSTAKSWAMYFLSAMMLVTSCLPVHAHLSHWHEHDDALHGHQSSIHAHQSIDHADIAPNLEHAEAHEFSVIDLPRDVASTQVNRVTATVAASSVCRGIRIPSRSLPTPADSTAFLPPHPVLYDGEPRAPPV